MYESFHAKYGSSKEASDKEDDYYKEYKFTSEDIARKRATVDATTISPMTDHLDESGRANEEAPKSEIATIQQKVEMGNMNEETSGGKV